MHGSNLTLQHFMPEYLMTNTTKTLPAESTAASTDTDKELIDAINTKDAQDGERMAKGGTRGGLVSDGTDIA